MKSVRNLFGRGKDTRLSMGRSNRHPKALRDNIEGITKPATRRLAFRGVEKRISGHTYGNTRGDLKVFMQKVIRDAVTCSTPRP